MTSSALSRESRTAALHHLAARELDVLVVGGGIVGAGCALDAVTRGLSVGMVEARDWSSGTSSRSSKLIHGGLRYLEMLDFRLVREALKERSLLLDTLAPHLVHPVSFLYPLRHRGWERLYAGSGVLLYDLMARVGSRLPGVPHHRHLSRRRALELFPSMRRGSLVGALQYYDGQTDDARFTTTVVRTAAAYGAVCASRTQVIDFLREGDQVVGAMVRDLESGDEFAVRARLVINATGVWTDDTQALLDQTSRIHVRASKGIHLVVPRSAIHGESGLILRTEKSVLFVIPWSADLWIIGTTDTDWDLDKAHPAASASDIQYVLDHVNAVLNKPITRADVIGVYAGLRPLLAQEDEATSKLSREHTVASPAPGLVVVAGGKYTTYRVMAVDAVDAAVAQLDQHVPASVTETVPLLGADGFPARWAQREAMAAASGLTVSWVEHLLHRYGTLTTELLALVAADPGLGEPLAGAPGYLAAEIVYAVQAEGALHLDDVLTRRTRISIEVRDRGVEAAVAAAALMAGPLGWDDVHQAREVEAYVARVQAELLSQEQPDDTLANVARTEAWEVVPTV
ncbi:glycerol-3-phosphate dehydrogenase/oxidase [Acidothermaceae bacterium B102]|nr:glycerol-3-phosphate dehydrogenase/oxidase [Acidothermaceae bacterium B102]